MRIPRSGFRQRLTELDFPEIAQIPGIGVIDLYSPGDLPNHDCGSYALDKDEKTFPEGYTETDGPEAGGIVVYMKGEQRLHFGKVVSDCRVRSKWGEWPVFEHDLTAVPYDYGNKVKFFRKVAPSAN